MDTSALLYIAIISALVCVGSAVVVVMTARRGPTARLEGDLNELAILVERLAKNDRRERMSAVRAGKKATVPPDAENPFERPPGLVLPGQQALDLGDRLEMKRRAFAARRNQ